MVINFLTVPQALDYQFMEATNGGMVADAWIEVLHTDTAEERHQYLRKSLADYFAPNAPHIVRLAWCVTRTISQSAQ